MIVAVVAINWVALIAVILGAADGFVRDLWTWSPRATAIQVQMPGFAWEVVAHLAFQLAADILVTAIMLIITLLAFAPYALLCAPFDRVARRWVAGPATV